MPTLVTIDTEYSSGAYADGRARRLEDNFDLAVGCKHSKGNVGILHQMDVMTRAGITGTFFVDPMPALVWGQRAVDIVVQPILERGHDVQLHCHTEWLELAPDNGLSPLSGQNIKDFPLADQTDIIAFGIEALMRAGAPFPVAFRAGNYGANDDTLHALAANGIGIDSSFPTGLVSDCEITMPIGDSRPRKLNGVSEFPIAALDAGGGTYRHAQVTSLSAREMRNAIRGAVSDSWPAFILISHSFELFDRKRRKPNLIVARRFAELCDWLSNFRETETDKTFADLKFEHINRPLTLPKTGSITKMQRNAAQLFSNLLYG